MIKVVPSVQRHFSDFGWLQTYWLFSFDSYYDPSNRQFGSLRVFNDDVVAPGSGFPTHSHREMEIVTVVLSGELTHNDSTGGNGVVRAGDVQRMSAGTGVSHSEYNFGEEPLHLYQIWIRPDKQNLTPGYDQRTFQLAASTNRLLPVASNRKLPNIVTVQADATIYLAGLERGAAIDFQTNPSRGVFVYLTSGRLEVNGKPLDTKDQARITVENRLSFEASENAEFVLIDVPYQL